MINLSQGENLRFFIPLLSLPLFLYGYTLDELVEISYQNQLVASVSHTVSSKEKAYESAQSSYLPSITLGASYQNAYEESPALAQDTLKVQANLRYNLYDGGQSSQIFKQLDASVNQSKESLNAMKNDIALDVTRLYFEYLSLLADKEATTQEMKQLQAELERLELFFKSGSATQDEVYKIDSRLKNATVTFHETELNIQKVLHTLEYYTTQEILEIQEGSFIELPQDVVNEIRPDIKALEFDASAALYDAKSTQSLNYPTLYFDNTLSHNEFYFNDKSKESDFLIETQNIAMLNLSWNILDFGATTQAYEAKQDAYLSKRALMEYEKHRADVDFRLAKKSLGIAELKVEASEATLQAATSTYDLIRFKYQNGTIDNVAYLQALSEKYSAQRVLERAKNDLQIKKAELIYHSGHTIKEFLK